MSRDLCSRVVFPPDTCKVFLGFLILPLQFLLLIPLVSFFLPLEDFLRSPYLDLVFILQVTSPSLSPTFRSFLRSAPEMRTEPGLSPDSSFVGSRVRSSRLRVAPTKSMDSSDSSLDLTTKAKNPKPIVAKRVSPVGGADILRLALLR